MIKSLDAKLETLRRNPDADVFILADAKDADMAFGIGAPGRSPESHSGQTRFRTLAEYRDVIREIVRQELVDIMLMSASTNEVLSLDERLFERSPVTPAARANDTTDIWAVREGKYVATPSTPFRSAHIDHIQCGALACAPGDRRLGANLGLYSVTFNNSTAHDLETLQAYRNFRLEAEQKGFDHFLEVFDPNAATVGGPEATGGFINDMIARTLAGAVGKSRPKFLKIVYHGPKAMEELHAYDPGLVIGVLGGSAGTTYDAFKLLAEAQKYGAKVALFGRKINQAENQFAFIRFLRLIVDKQISPEEAVRAYHAVLQRLGVKPHRRLEDDLALRTGVMSYGGSATTISIPLPKAGPTGEDRTIVPAAHHSSPAAGCRCHDVGGGRVAATKANQVVSTGTGHDHGRDHRDQHASCSCATADQQAKDLCACNGSAKAGETDAGRSSTSTDLKDATGGKNGKAKPISNLVSPSPSGMNRGYPYLNGSTAAGFGVYQPSYSIRVAVGDRASSAEANAESPFFASIRPADRVAYFRERLRKIVGD